MDCLPSMTTRETNQQAARNWDMSSAWLSEQVTTPMVTHRCTLPDLAHRRSYSFGDVVQKEKEIGEEELAPLRTAGLFRSSRKSATAAPNNNHHHHAEPAAAAADAAAATPIPISIMYGLINAIIVLPILISFGSIIYRDEVFQPYIPGLTKLTLVSGMVHQLSFSTFSSLPFAVGQVQDAGLIFLSKMASDLAHACISEGYDDMEQVLATVTVGLGLYTAMLGVAVVLIGQLKLAQYIQLLPTAVVGGYLAYIGWFCGAAGIGLMNDDGGDGENGWSSKWIGMTIPGILGGFFIYGSVRVLRHMAVLPTCIFLLMVIFYVCLWITGTSIQEATDYGWIRQTDPPPPWNKTWSYLQFDKVVWSLLPSQWMTQMGMIFVVALSSSLDVAAIELELQAKETTENGGNRTSSNHQQDSSTLNYNSELTMVGMSNIFSGLTGGYTGSYIFSQSIFSLRAGINSRLAGFIIALVEFIMVIIPFSVLSYVPNFFFGSLLIMICIDLVYEWLWDVRTKVTEAEYGVALGTFCLIQVVGVEYGIVAGTAIYFLLWLMGFEMTKQQEVNSQEANNLGGSTYGASDSSLLYSC